MIAYARIENDRILDLIDFDPNDRFHIDIAKLYQLVPTGLKENALLISGEWRNPPDPLPLTQDQIDLLEAQEAAYITEQQKESLRKQRNVLLSNCDWTQGKDVPESISSIWAVYRQALRDIPQQPEFPINVTWPTPPSS